MSPTESKGPFFAWDWLTRRGQVLKVTTAFAMCDISVATVDAGWFASIGEIAMVNTATSSWPILLIQLGMTKFAILRNTTPLVKIALQ